MYVEAGIKLIQILRCLVILEEQHQFQRKAHAVEESQIPDKPPLTELIIQEKIGKTIWFYIYLGT